VFPVVCRAHADDNELPAGAVQPHVIAGRLCLPHDVLQRLHQRRLYPHAQNLPQARRRKGYLSHFLFHRASLNTCCPLGSGCCFFG